FVRENLIQDISDIYRLPDQRATLLGMERFGHKSVENLLGGIASSKAKPFEKVLFALGIRYVGETVAKKLAAHFERMDHLAEASYESLLEVHEIGERIAESVVHYFAEPKNKGRIEALRAAGLRMEIDRTNREPQGTSLAGKTFVISGVFERFSREDLQALIEGHGGKMLSSISSKLNYLVAGDKMGPSKLAKAEKLQIPI